jgi:hypothetical protein
MIFWLLLKLEIIYRVILSWRILVSFRGFFWRLYFCMVKYLHFHNSSFALRYVFNVNGKATVWHTPLFKFVMVYEIAVAREYVEILKISLASRSSEFLAIWVGSIFELRFKPIAPSIEHFGFRVSTKCGPRSCGFRLDCTASWLLSYVAALACRSVMVMVVAWCCCIFHRALPLLTIRAIVCSPLASLLLLLRLLNCESQDLVHSH